MEPIEVVQVVVTYVGSNRPHFLQHDLVTFLTTNMQNIQHPKLRYRLGGKGKKAFALVIVPRESLDTRQVSHHGIGILDGA